MPMSEETTPPPGDDDAPEMPAVVKQLAWVWHHTQANRELLVRGPVLAFAVLAAFGGWWFGSTREAEVIKVKDETLNTRNERISFLEDQLTAYKDRLQGATPDEAAKKFSTLEKIIAGQNEKLQLLSPDNPRHLSDEQKAYLTSCIADIKENVKLLNIFAYSIGDSPFYANEFYELFKSNNISVYSIVMTTCDANQRGVLVGIVDPKNPRRRRRNLSKF
jgi:hypothetical protein